MWFLALVLILSGMALMAAEYTRESGDDTLRRIRERFDDDQEQNGR